MKKRQWWVYIVLCSDNTFYCGITVNIDKRVGLHNTSKGAKYTRGRTPVKLVYKEKMDSQSIALKREYQIKQLKRKDKMLLVVETK